MGAGVTARFTSAAYANAPPGSRICTACMGLGHTPLDRRAILLLGELARWRAIRAHALPTPALHARVEDVLARETGRRCGQTATNNTLVEMLAAGLADRYPGGGPIPDRWVITPKGRKALALRSGT